MEGSHAPSRSKPWSVSHPIPDVLELQAGRRIISSERHRQITHAFSIEVAENHGGSNRELLAYISVQGELALQPLDECEEEVDSDLEDTVDPQPAIIVTNMENLTLQSDARATESSLVGEAPSAPTA